MATKDDLVELTLNGVEAGEAGAAVHYLDLRERDGGRRLPVYVGPPEAGAIAFALQGRQVPRPMTHDALKQAVDVVGRLARIEIGHAPETSTFTADVVVDRGEVGELRFDWRVSDAVAVAVRCDPRPAILAPASLLGPDEPGVDPPPAAG